MVVTEAGGQRDVLSIGAVAHAIQDELVGYLGDKGLAEAPAHQGQHHVDGGDATGAGDLGRDR